MCHVPAVSNLVLIIILKYNKYCVRFEVLTVVLKKVQASGL
jgi:hypothetical protein